MKVSKGTPQFTPVNIVLETQAEVDSLYALLNHRMSDFVGLPDQWEMLKPFRSAAAEALHQKLCDRIALK